MMRESIFLAIANHPDPAPIRAARDRVDVAVEELQDSLDSGRIGPAIWPHQELLMEISSALHQEILARRSVPS